MTLHDFPFPLGVQITLSSNNDYPALLDQLRTIQKLSYSVIELNIENLDSADLSDIKQCLSESDLSMSNLATGATAKFEKLSLSSSDLEVRTHSITRTRKMIEVAAFFNAGMIIGFMKGGPSGDPESARERLTDSLNRITDIAEDKEVLILLEATNRHETVVAKTIQETNEIIKEVGSEALTILPDTYHMNIEEPSLLGSLPDSLSKFQTIHLSDDNRRFPGFGTIDFPSLFQFLTDAGYDGYLTLEGNTELGFEADLAAATNYLTRTFQTVGR